MITVETIFAMIAGCKLSFISGNVFGSLLRSQISAGIADKPRCSEEGNEKDGALLREILHAGAQRQERQAIQLQENVIAPSTPPLSGASMRPCMTVATTTTPHLRGAGRCNNAAPRPVSRIRRGTPATTAAIKRIVRHGSKCE